MKCLVIIVNRCQTAYLGCYGNDWLPTPNLDRFASESVVFDQHYADSPSEPGARRSWGTGRYGFFPGGFDAWLAPSLWQQGIATALIGDERSPSRDSRFADGWESQRWIRSDRLALLEQDSLLGGTVQTALEWLEDHGKQDNWLLWMELTSLRPPWSPAEHDPEALQGAEEAELEPWFDPPAGRVGQEIAESDCRRLSATYAGVVSGVDQWLGQLFDNLRETGLYDELLILLTSDCGLPLGEHGQVGDGVPWLHEELVHLPLILHLPKGAEAGRRVQQLTQPVDLLPTLLGAFGQPIPEQVHGHSLLPVAHGKPVNMRDYACSRLHLGRAAEWAIRTQHWYFLLPSPEDGQRKVQLYVKPEDRWEVNNVVSQYPEVAEHLELTLRRLMAVKRRSRSPEFPELRPDVLNVVRS